MFVGHYAAAFALKGNERSTSLGMLFIAVQFVDILFFPFVVMGIERIKLEDHANAVNNFNLEFMPYTHSLVGCLFWSFLFYLLYLNVISKGKPHAKNIALMMFFGVLSHWFTDLIAHMPDLPILYGEPRFGFGLWRSKLLTFITETVLIALSVYYYISRTQKIKPSGQYLVIGFAGLLVFMDYLSFYILPPEKEVLPLAISALLAYSVFAGLAFWVDTKRA